MLLLTFFLLLAVGLGSYVFGRGKARGLADKAAERLHSLPHYHGVMLAFWTTGPALGIIILGVVLEAILSPLVITSLLKSAVVEANLGLSEQSVQLLVLRAKAMINGEVRWGEVSDVVARVAFEYSYYKQIGWWGISALSMMCVVVAFLAVRGRVALKFPARPYVEKGIKLLMVAVSAIAIMITVGIVLSLLFETARFFARVPFADFLFGLHWSPQTSIRGDQVGSSGSFGMIPLFTGTLLITLIAMAVAVPLGIFSAIYMSEYVPSPVRTIVKPTLEILAGIPTVIYGFFAIILVAPFLKSLGAQLGISVASESALAAGLVMGIMIVPLISSLSDDAIRMVPRDLREGALALGSTKAEVVRRIVLPAALPGIIGSVLLAISRAIGETMIVVMAAGMAANLTANPLEAVTTVTVQIVALIVGDQEFDSAKTLAAFALGLALFAITFILNIIALMTVRRYREKYE